MNFSKQKFGCTLIFTKEVLIMKLVFATNNKHKLEEISAIVGDKIEILSLNDIGCHDDIPETADTFEGNALQKARYVKEKYGYDCFADDTGLQVVALNGEPGVYSARYAGEPANSEKNIDKLLANLENRIDRRASFITCIALILGDEEHLFYGEIEGSIINERRGSSGFGYDSVFVPEGHDKTFAQMGEEQKNKISHRARAVKKLSEFLNTL